MFSSLNSFNSPIINIFKFNLNTPFRSFYDLSESKVSVIMTHIHSYKLKLIMTGEKKKFHAKKNKNKYLSKFKLLDYTTKCEILKITTMKL